MLSLQANGMTYPNRYGIKETNGTSSQPSDLPKFGEQNDLNTAQDNFSAQALYEKLGFVKDTEYFSYNLAVK